MSCGIYKIENKLNHKVYIGQSIEIEKRFQKHKNANDDFAIHKALKKYGIENFDFSIIELCDEEKLNEQEQYWIIKYNSLLPYGYNMIPGGTNNVGKYKGKEVLQYSLQGELLNSFKSAHEANRQTQINFGDICRCCREEISQAGGFQWKYKNSLKEIQPIICTMYNQIIQQFDLNYNLIAEYNTLQEAADAVNLSKASICRACKGKNNTSGGYIWQYKNNPTKYKKEKEIKLNLIVLQLNKKDNSIIAEFENASEASRQTKINRGNIGQCLNKKRQSAGGYKWIYKKEYNNNNNKGD